MDEEKFNLELMKELHQRMESKGLYSHLCDDTIIWAHHTLAFKVNGNQMELWAVGFDNTIDGIPVLLDKIATTNLANPNLFKVIEDLMRSSNEKSPKKVKDRID